MSAVNDILRLADKLREAQALADRTDSLEQACKEAEARLTDLRAQEEAARLRADQARVFLNDQEVGARAQADAIVSAARAAARREMADAQAAIDRERAEAATALIELTEKRDALQESCTLLEAAESTLGQKVASLQSALASLRSQLV